MQQRREKARGQHAIIGRRQPGTEHIAALQRAVCLKRF
jgi:hypothetical protein